jgi:hypothetical protein
MSNIRIDKQKALKKWAPVLENMGVAGDERLDWMSELAEYHSINENAYVNAANAGMGSVVGAQPSVYAGSTNFTAGAVGTSTYANALGNLGSGDVGQNMLPVAMKIAAQTIGLDLVSVKPTPGPKLDLLYIDFQYDDVDTTQANPVVFKYTDVQLLSYRASIRAFMVANSIVETTGGLAFGSTTGASARIFVNIATGVPTITAPVATGDKQNIVEFLGFSRIDGQLMFRAYRQANAVGNFSLSSSSPYAAPYAWDQTQNTFSPTNSMVSQIDFLPFATTGFTASGATATTVTDQAINLISALEDHLPGFSTNFSANSKGGLYPMSRAEDDLSYAGVIGPKVSTKSIAVGTIEVSSVLRRTEIEDIKANTGMDIVQKMESILVNELSQTISKQIVAKIFEMGDLNRTSAPSFGGTPSITGHTVFDLDTNYAAAGPGGETTHSIQRKLITKMVHASNFIATEGRVGPAQFAVTNGALAATLMDISGYTINPVKSKMNATGQLYPVGQIGDMQVYVDPYMKYNDNRIVIGRKNNPDQPGILFVPYLMAQSISIISEATFAPRMLLRSRYAVAEVGWYPQKQFMTIVVKDTNSYLN